MALQLPLSLRDRYDLVYFASLFRQEHVSLVFELSSSFIEVSSDFGRKMNYLKAKKESQRIIIGKEITIILKIGVNHAACYVYSPKAVTTRTILWICKLYFL